MMPLGPTAQRAPSSVPQRATAPASPLEPAGNVSVRTPTGPVQLYSRSTTTPSAAAKKVAPVGSTQTSVRSSGDSGRPSAVQDMPPSEDTTTLSCAPLATMTLPMLVPRTSHNVPAGATLRPFVERAYPLIRQSIHINVVDRPGSSIVASTGCASATGPGEHVLSLDDDCLESGKGELFIYALQNGTGAYIEVKDIIPGIAELDPLDVPLPDWTYFPVGDERVRIDTTGLPDAVTGAVGLYAVRGHRSVMGTTATVVASDAGSGTAISDALLPTTGTRWVRSASFYPVAQPDSELAARSYRTEPLAYPLASPATYDFGTLLPIPAHLELTQGAGATITFDLPAHTGDVDRIVATFAWGDPKDPILWHVVTKPTTTRISLPNIPSYLATPEASMLWVEVRAEDHPDVEGWVNVLKDWHDTFLFQSPEQWPTGRMSRSVWQTPANPADADPAD